MNTDKLYIASLRVVVKREAISNFYMMCTHNHLKYVLVKSSSMMLFKDVKTGEIYTTNFHFRTAIDLDKIESFNEVTGNTEIDLPKQKVISLFDKKINEMK